MILGGEASKLLEEAGLSPKLWEAIWGGPHPSR
jgi:hypothetical protein